MQANSAWWFTVLVFVPATFIAYRRLKELLMSTNDELAGIQADLTEALTEIPALIGTLNDKIDQLLDQAGDTVDAALVASIKADAQTLADIVPNVPAPPVDETPVPEPEPEAPVEGTPIEVVPPSE